MNDDALTPLDLARNRGHVNIVRMIEVFFSIHFDIFKAVCKFWD